MMKVTTAKDFARALRSAAKWYQKASVEDLAECSAFDEAETVFRTLKSEISLNSDS